MTKASANNKCVTVVGARPQFIKAAPVSRTMHTFRIKEVLVHTGQHYDDNMSRVFFHELELREPDYNLGIGSLPQGAQTGRMMEKIEEVLLRERPALVLVYGDTNSTLAAALAAAKLHIPVAHIEAGLRSFNRKMPEEINRLLTDHVSAYLFCPTETGVKNLRKEGFATVINRGRLIDNSMAIPSREKPPFVINVGDVMYDSVLFNQALAMKRSTILRKLGMRRKEFYLATLHRAENTDDPARLKEIFNALGAIGKDRPVIVPLHPRTSKLIADVRYADSVRVIPPLPYLDMLVLTGSAKVVLTDSGGLQKEAYFLDVPCVTLRDETEWVETLKRGRNILAGASKKGIIRAVGRQEEKTQGGDRNLYFGDGNASGKIVRIIKGVLG